MQLTDSEKRMYRVVGADGEDAGFIPADKTREWAPMDYRPGWYVQAAEAASEVGAEPTGHPRTSPLIRAWRAVRRWLF